MNAIIILSSLGIIAMLAEMFSFKKSLWYLVLAGLAVVFVVNLLDWNLDTPEQQFKNMILFDNYAVAFGGLIIILVFAWFLISYNHYKDSELNVSDHFSLIIFSSVGALILVSYTHLSMLFLGVEILSIPLYILAGSMKKDLASNEASLKYFMLGAFATGILLFGITMLYGATGTFNIVEIGMYVQKSSEISILFYSGLMLVLIALAFKVSAAPFHFWTPDVYQGAPVLITAFMATIVKTAAFAAFFRLFSNSFGLIINDWNFILSIITALTIVLGNILAAYQTSVKRLLAYSGISQAGYLLMTILAVNQESSKMALLLYTASYSISTLGAFGVLYHVMKSKGSDSLDSFNSLGKTQPLLGFVMAVSMLSLAGIPPTIGFFAKFYLFSNLLSMGNTYLWLVIVAIVGSLVSVYYYFKVIIAMYAKEGAASPLMLTTFHRALLIIITGLIIIIGLAPGILVSMDNFKI
ncbi:MAG: NADH-quinone oxidoreductase subunit N [Cytophagaceae bacterium]|nr:NADH-quinone oxidoreductase subunit N [Cytophagaceae bacterium]